MKLLTVVLALTRSAPTLVLASPKKAITTTCTSKTSLTGTVHTTCRRSYPDRCRYFVRSGTDGHCFCCGLSVTSRTAFVSTGVFSAT